MQRKLQKGAQCRRTNETAAHHFNNFMEVMTYDKNTNKVELVLIWKTTDNSFNGAVARYRNNKEIAKLEKNQFGYARRGDYLVATATGDPLKYPNYWAGIGEWRIDPKIRGNVRGCI